jgi:hypothetical protein
MKYEKTPYKADAIQWDGRNSAEVIAMFDEACLYDTDHIMIRYDGSIVTLSHGWWVVTGENGYIKCYSDKVFRVKYREC